MFCKFYLFDLYSHARYFCIYSSLERSTWWKSLRRPSLSSRISKKKKASKGTGLKHCGRRVLTGSWNGQSSEQCKWMGTDGSPKPRQETCAFVFWIHLGWEMEACLKLVFANPKVSPYHCCQSLHKVLIQRHRKALGRSFLSKPRHAIYDLGLQQHSLSVLGTGMG